MVTALESHRPLSPKDMRQASHAVPGRELGTRFVVLALLLAECEGFVGKFSNHMSRLVYALMAARHPTGDCLQPFVSLDAPWCFGLNCDLTSWMPPAAPIGSHAKFSGLSKGAVYTSGSMLRLRTRGEKQKGRFR